MRMFTFFPLLARALSCNAEHYSCSVLFPSCQHVPPPHCYVCFDFNAQHPHAAAERRVLDKSHECHQTLACVVVILWVFPRPPAKALSQRLDRLTGLLFGKGCANNRHAAALPHDGRKNPHLVGSGQFAVMEAALFPNGSSIFLACVLRWPTCFGIPDPQVTCALPNVRPVEKAILPPHGGQQTAPRLCKKDPLCRELARHPVKISFHFS